MQHFTLHHLSCRDNQLWNQRHWPGVAEQLPSLPSSEGQGLSTEISPDDSWQKLQELQVGEATAEGGGTRYGDLPFPFSSTWDQLSGCCSCSEPTLCSCTVRSLSFLASGCHPGGILPAAAPWHHILSPEPHRSVTSAGTCLAPHCLHSPSHCSALQASFVCRRPQVTVAEVRSPASQLCCSAAVGLARWALRCQNCSPLCHWHVFLHPSPLFPAVASQNTNR